MQKIKNFIKHNSFFGTIYLVIMSFILRVLQLCVPIQDKQIVFASYSGRQCSDSPYIIYQQLKDDKRFKEYKLIWAFVDPNEFSEIPVENKVKMDTFSFWKVLLQSKFWISNSSIERLIPSIHGKHIYINTWHGIPLKHLGPDELNLEFLVKNWFKNVKFDLLYCSGEYDKKIFEHIFPSAKNIRILGLPRNRELMTNLDEVRKQKIYDQLHLNQNKKTILYAPTFREYSQKNGSNSFTLPFSEKFIEQVTQKYNFMIRGHYFIENLEINSKMYNEIVDVSKYENLNELFQISDIVISDYSSLIFDYALLEKDIVLYLNDIEEYEKYRGFYLSPRNLELKQAFTEQGLIEKINNLNDKNFVVALNKEFNQYFDVNSNYLKNFIINGR